MRRQEKSYDEQSQKQESSSSTNLESEVGSKSRPRLITIGSSGTKTAERRDFLPSMYNSSPFRAVLDQSVVDRRCYTPEEEISETH